MSSHRRHKQRDRGQGSHPARRTTTCRVSATRQEGRKEGVFGARSWRDPTIRSLSTFPSLLEFCSQMHRTRTRAVFCGDEGGTGNTRIPRADSHSGTSDADSNDRHSERADNPTPSGSFTAARRRDTRLHPRGEADNGTITRFKHSTRHQASGRGGGTLRSQRGLLRADHRRTQEGPRARTREAPRAHPAGPKERP